MGGKRILSDEQIELMCQLREKGWSIEWIADHFTRQGTKVSANAINWQCMVHGADAPPHLRGKHTQAAAPYSRNGHTVRPYSAEDDRLLLELARSGARRAEIAAKLGRAHSSIRGRLLTLARRDARREHFEADAA